VTDIVEMDPDLVGPAGFQTAHHEGVSLKILNGSKASRGRLALWGYPPMVPVGQQANG
jgi:hypothetical protein